MATTIDYPTTLPCALLAGNKMQGGRTFLRSEFDSNIRQRKQYCSQYEVGYTFFIESKAQMLLWRDFYYTTLDNGVKSFNSDFEVEGSVIQKEFRFASTYTATALGEGRYSITAIFDLLTPIQSLT